MFLFQVVLCDDLARYRRSKPSSSSAVLCDDLARSKPLVSLARLAVRIQDPPTPAIDLLSSDPEEDGEDQSEADSDVVILSPSPPPSDSEKRNERRPIVANLQNGCALKSKKL